MNIHSKYTDKCSYQSFKAIPPVYKKIPEIVGNVGKYVGEYISMPEQKLLLASTALLFQPLIDLKFAEEDKRVDSAIKSSSKAIAGGITGVPIRAFFIWLANYCIRPKDQLKCVEHPIIQKGVNVIQQNLFPLKNQKLRQENVPLANFKLGQYNKTIGTLAAIIFMFAFSNSKLDVPLTAFIQDFLTKVVKEKKPWSQSFAEVCADRKQRVKAWCANKKNNIDNVISKSKKIVDIIKQKPVDKKASGEK